MITNEEKNLLSKLKSGVLDGIVGDTLENSAATTFYKKIVNGIPTSFKEGKWLKIFNGKENELCKGTLHKLEEWSTDTAKLQFLQKFGWLMKDEAVKAYSAKFKL